MATKVGVWIDHKKAVVVLITDKGEETRRVRSGVGQPGRSTVRSRSEHKYGPNDFVAEDRLERKFMDQLNKYYDEIITCIRDAGAILILGPGEAKGEFSKRIKGKKLRGRVVQLETADKMTDRQIAAHVRQHFMPVPGKEKSRKISRMNHTYQGQKS